MADFCLLTVALVFSSDYEAVFLDVYANHWQIAISPPATLSNFLGVATGVFFCSKSASAARSRKIATQTPHLILALTVALAVMLGLQIQLRKQLFFTLGKTA